MKSYRLLLLIALLFCSQPMLYAQPTSEAEAKEMARKLMAMTPAQIMKFRDSMMKAVMQKQARALPNGNQLLIKHHYDTTYTTVHFYYMKKVTESHSNGGNSGSTIYICAGKSFKAPMMYEKNGYTMVQCSMNPPGANTDNMDKMANGINKGKKYLSADQALKNQDVARIMAFSSMTINDNSLSGTASENSNYSSAEGQLTITTKPPITNMAFSFTYDPVQVLSTIAIGATINISTSGVDNKTHIHSHRDDVMSVGMGATTDPQFAKIVGLSAPSAPDADAAYIKVTKTANGFKIAYTKSQYIRESNAHIMETLTADIGGPMEQYEAVLKPMPDSKYETWLPKGPRVDGTDDTKGDDSSRFYVEVHDKDNPNKLYPGNFTVKYELKEVTRYKGFNSNYPVYGAADEKDLKISDTVRYFSPGTFDMSAGVSDSVATSVVNNGALAIMRVMCMDYGAWGKLTAHVTLDDGTEFYAYPYYDKGKTYITIPFDKDDNKIADAWEKSEKILNNGYGLTWDEDLKPDNGNAGDNIALIDEYRGFLTEDDGFNPVYMRLSPQVKELFTIGLSNMTGFGQTYKTAVRIGAMGYGKATNIKIYHFSNSKYGYHEDGVSGATYGRWVNYNSPLAKHVHGIAIYADDNLTADPDLVKAMATTIPLAGLDHPGNGAFVPDEIREVHLWTNYIVNVQPFKPVEFLPARPEGNDAFAQRMAARIASTNAEFHVNIDANHASPIVAQYFDVNISRIISFTVAHELCHTTNIHHHHLADEATDPLAFFKGDANCLIRYWGDSNYMVNCATWRQMYIFGLWNPADIVTPGGTPIALCKTGDDCFHQMKLKKN